MRRYLGAAVTAVVVIMGVAVPAAELLTGTPLGDELIAVCRGLRDSGTVSSRPPCPTA
jgi:hypothetical protein